MATNLYLQHTTQALHSALLGGRFVPKIGTRVDFYLNVLFL